MMPWRRVQQAVAAPGQQRLPTSTLPAVIPATAKSGSFLRRWGGRRGPSQVELPRRPSQVELPFTGLGQPWAVAVDTADNVYVVDVNLAKVSLVGRPFRVENGAVVALPTPFFYGPSRP